MSYILDALNKSEQERARKRAPGLAELHGDQDRSAFTAIHFLIILVVLIVVNLIGFYLLFGDRFQSVSEPTEVSSVEQPPEASATAEFADTVEVPVTASAEEPELITPPTRPVQASPVDFDYEALPIEELPRAIQVRLPAVEVTTHIYASDAELRMVKIDGEARYEGDILTTDFRLLEITETGVILEFEGYAYVLDVIEDWLDPS